MKPLAGSKVHSPFCQSICFLDELLKRIFRDKAFIYIPNLETKHDLTLYCPILDQSHTWLRFKLILLKSRPNPTPHMRTHRTALHKHEAALMLAALAALAGDRGIA